MDSTLGFTGNVCQHPRKSTGLHEGPYAKHDGNKYCTKQKVSERAKQFVIILGTFLCRPPQNSNVKWKFFVAWITWTTTANFFVFVFVAYSASIREYIVNSCCLAVTRIGWLLKFEHPPPFSDYTTNPP